MIKTIPEVGRIGAVLLLLATTQGCFKVQRAAGCNNPGVLGCKDDPSAVQVSPSGLEPDQGRVVDDRESLEFRVLDDCSADKALRTECAERPPATRLGSLEATEFEN